MRQKERKDRRKEGRKEERILKKLNFTPRFGMKGDT